MGCPEKKRSDGGRARPRTTREGRQFALFFSATGKAVFPIRQAVTMAQAPPRAHAARGRGQDPPLRLKLRLPEHE
jgi:hypothetical protein